MGSIKPVVADAIVDPGRRGARSQQGRADGPAQQGRRHRHPGITVTAGGVSSVTDENGCAVLGNLDAGPQTLSYSAAGYVDKDANPAPSKPVTIGAGTIAQATGSYDVAGTINTTIVDRRRARAPANAVAGEGGDRPRAAVDAHARSRRPRPTGTQSSPRPPCSRSRAVQGVCRRAAPATTRPTRLCTNAGAAPGAQVDPEHTTATLTMRRRSTSMKAPRPRHRHDRSASARRQGNVDGAVRAERPLHRHLTSRHRANDSIPAIGPQPDFTGKITFPLPRRLARLRDELHGLDHQPLVPGQSWPARRPPWAESQTTIPRRPRRLR